MSRYLLSSALRSSVSSSTLSFAARRQGASVCVLVVWIVDTIEKECEWCSDETIHAMSGSRRRSIVVSFCHGDDDAVVLMPRRRGAGSEVGRTEACCFHAEVVTPPPPLLRARATSHVFAPWRGQRDDDAWLLRLPRSSGGPRRSLRRAAGRGGAGGGRRRGARRARRAAERRRSRSPSRAERALAPLSARPPGAAGRGGWLAPRGGAGGGGRAAASAGRGGGGGSSAGSGASSARRLLALGSPPGERPRRLPLAGAPRPPGSPAPRPSPWLARALLELRGCLARAALARSAAPRLARRGPGPPGAGAPRRRARGFGAPGRRGPPRGQRGPGAALALAPAPARRGARPPRGAAGESGGGGSSFPALATFFPQWKLSLLLVAIALRFFDESFDVLVKTGES